MNFLELVKNRYSCRAYKPLGVEREKLDYRVCNFDAALCKQLFGLPANEEPAVLIPLGYAAERLRVGDGTSGIEIKPKNRKTIEEIVR